MQNVTVTCACSRKMSPDPLRGRGAYRCGCGSGARVEVKSSTRDACAVSDCRVAVSADSLVVPLCKPHLAKMRLAMVPSVYLKYPPDTWLTTRAEYEQEFGKIPSLPLAAQMPWLMTQPVRPDTTHDSIVYFLAIGEQVKIGTTINKRQRFASMLPPGAKFILELPGSYGLEHRLHAQFAADRLEGEWFKLSDQIKAYVAENQHLSRPPKQRSAT